MTKICLKFFAIICTSCVVSVSCSKEPLSGRFGRADNLIQAAVSTSSIQTKGDLDGQAGRFLGSYPLDGLGGDSLCIAVYEFDNSALPEEFSRDASPQTKGQVVTTDYIRQQGRQFTMNAWLESTNRSDPADAEDYHFMKSATATCDGASWALSCPSPASDNWNRWRNQVPTNFWATYPASLGSGQGTVSVTWPANNASDDDQKKLAFEYTLPAPSTDDRDAENQADLCFAYSRKTWDESVSGNDNMVNLSLNHALSAVYFSTSGVLDAISVKKVGFNNVPSSGHCDMTGTPDALNGNPGKTTFDWKDQSGLKNYRQAYLGSDFDGSSKTMNLDKSSKVFMMIPHTLDASTEIYVRFEVNGTTVDKKVNISRIGNGDSVVWKPGKKYLYKLSFKGLNNFTFYFSETGNPAAITRSFTNTTSSGSATINVTSAAVNAEEATVDNIDWQIKEVTYEGVTTAVNASSFSNIGGFSASKSGNKLTVTSPARTSASWGDHDHWLNQNPIRTDGLDWSPADWSDKGVIDLSRTDFTSDSEAAINANARTTANCYIIRHAGTYRFPLVYGNAIVNGATNSQAYAPSPMASGGTNFLANFKDHLDQNITGPYLPQASSCGVIWQDEAELIKNLSLTTDGGIQYVQFSISQNEICQNNALIAVKDEGGKIMWSWHIWITNNPALLQSAIPVKNNTDVTYNFFPVYNLGWIDPASYQASEDLEIVLEQKSSESTPKTITLTVNQSEIWEQGRGCWYQFGRKDPMCRVDNPKSGSFDKGGTGRVTLGKAIQNPGIFYNYDIIKDKNTDTQDWCSSSYYNLWTGRFSEAGQFDQKTDMIKTVYDPSPRGYKIPASNAYTGFTTTGDTAKDSSEFNVKGSFSSGWNFKTGIDDNTIFFPAAGCRFNATGSVSYIGNFGFYWPAVPVNKNFCYCLCFGTNYIYPFYANANSHTFGYSVRPVLE